MLFNVFKWLEAIQNGYIKEEHVFECEDWFWAIFGSLSAQNILLCAAVGAWLRNSRGHFRKHSYHSQKDLLAVHFLSVSFKHQLYIGEVVNTTLTNSAQFGKTSLSCSWKCNSISALCLSSPDQECVNTTWKSWGTSDPWKTACEKEKWRRPLLWKPLVGLDDFPAGFCWVSAANPPGHRKHLCFYCAVLSHAIAVVLPLSYTAYKLQHWFLHWQLASAWFLSGCQYLLPM